QPSVDHWGEGFAEISDWRVGPDGALWYCRQSQDFAASTGSIGRVEGPGVLAVPPPPIAPRLTLRVRVSPALGSAPLVAGTPVEATLWIVDVGGRAIRQLPAAGGHVVAGSERALTWDGRDDGGRAVPAGIYVVVLEAGASVLARRIVLIR